MIALKQSERWWRAGIAGTCFLGLAGARWFDPAEGSGWILSNPLTQRIFGVPCPFCGMTRGTHALLNGHWQEMFYLNPATVAVVVPGALLCLIWLVEAVCGRALFDWGRRLQWFQQRWFLWLSVLILFWIFHLFVAVNGPKPELLSPDAPLFPSFLF